MPNCLSRHVLEKLILAQNSQRGIANFPIYRRNRPHLQFTQDYKAEIEAQDGLLAMETCEYTNLPKYEFAPNVLARVLLSSERMTLFLVEIPLGGKIPAHSHPHEQMGICLNGEAQFISGTEKKIVHKGMVYKIGPNEMHEVQVIGSERGLFLDIFCPPRTEYVSKQTLFETHNQAATTK